MTNEEMLVDLKQFIEVTVSQQLSQIATELVTKEDLRGEINSLESRLSDRIDTLDEKLDQVQDGVAEILNHLAESTDKILQNHEKRLTRLERKPA